ncbi:MAG: hypothetical protein GXO71_06730 [Caldiserica bacterium]|nr:hypothetical protein [Caldisericota bacterium]
MQVTNLRFKELGIISLCIVFAFPLFSGWELKISGSNIDLSSLRLANGFYVKEGKMELEGDISPGKEAIEYKIKAKAENILIEGDKLPGELSLPYVVFHLAKEKWNVEEGKGEWNNLNFTFRGKGDVNPFSYQVTIFLESFPLSKLQEMLPSLTLPAYILPLKGDFQVTLKGSEVNSVEGEIMASSLNPEWVKNFNFAFSWDNKILTLSQVNIDLKKGKVEGKGVIEWNIPNP